MSEARRWTRLGGTLSCAPPVRNGHGASRLLESMRRLGADDRLLQAAQAAVAGTRRTSTRS